MVEVKTEVSVIGRCRCCLKDSNLKDLWGDHFQYGNREVYGEILSECFAFAWNPPIESDYIEQICESCIAQLRQAYNFRAEILATERYLFENCDNGNLLKCATFQKDCDGSNVDVKEEEEPLIKILVTDDPDPSYEDVEFLEEALDDSVQEQTSRRKQILKRTLEAEDQIKPKRPKKKKKGDKTRTYKNYEEETLRKCVQAVITDNMKLSEASKMYGIPLKTLKGRVKTIQETGMPVKSDRHFTFVEEVKTLLTYTNVMPFKSPRHRYQCLYCDGKEYDDTDELKRHVRSAHARDRIRDIERALRPAHFHETIKVDIESLHCTVCCQPLTWHELFEHLHSTHGLVFQEAQSRVIPFLLGSDKCALCKKRYFIFLKLDDHMNVHFKNHTCACGQTFLSMQRLKAHERNHGIGEYRCDQCGKVFSLKRYLKKHFDLVHNKILGIKCKWCPDRFTSEYPRHEHVREKHPEKVRKCTCEKCGITFDWKPYYNKHIKRHHLLEVNKIQCRFCTKKYALKYDLRKHEARVHGVQVLEVEEMLKGKS